MKDIIDVSRYQGEIAWDKLKGQIGGNTWSPDAYPAGWKEVA